jgi:DNA polymerase III alpha subunit
VDFAWDERDDVLATVLDQYRDHAAMVCNHVLFKPRMAVRETAKVYGLTDGEIGRVTKRLPWFWRATGTGTTDGLMSGLQQRPEPRPWISCRTPGPRSSPWPGRSSASPATCRSIPAAWSSPRAH